MQSSLSLTYIHTHRAQTGCMAYENKSFPRFILTQNTRLKANIRYLMHISPPDSAAMAKLERRITLQTERRIEKKSLSITLCRTRLLADASALTRVVQCAPIVVRPHMAAQPKPPVDPFSFSHIP